MIHLIGCKIKYFIIIGLWNKKDRSKYYKSSFNIPGTNIKKYLLEIIILEVINLI